MYPFRCRVYAAEGGALLLLHDRGTCDPLPGESVAHNLSACYTPSGSPKLQGEKAHLDRVVCGVDHDGAAHKGVHPHPREGRILKVFQVAIEGLRAVDAVNPSLAELAREIP